MDRILKAIRACSGLPESVRVSAYNAATKALRAMVVDVCDDPALAPQLVQSDDIEANDYNPNNVAFPEMDLLEQSIREDGVTMPLVTCRDRDRRKWVMVDGFHRHLVLRDRLGRKYLPCSEIDSAIVDRMASTVRHNRARGKHQVDLMAAMVRSMLQLGWDDEKIAHHLGMSVEELLRLKQVAGVAHLLAADEYSQSWGPIDDPVD
jgi:ParB-like chromosome segregation protein Spo0J